MIFWTSISLESNDSIPGGRRPGGKCGVWQPPTTSTDGTTAALVITPVWLIASYWSAYDTLARRDYDRCPADLLTCCPLLLYHPLYVSVTATRVLFIVSRIKSHFLRTTTTHVSIRDHAHTLFLYWLFWFRIIKWTIYIEIPHLVFIWEPDGGLRHSQLRKPPQ